MVHVPNLVEVARRQKEVEEVNRLGVEVRRYLEAGEAPGSLAEAVEAKEVVHSTLVAVVEKLSLHHH